MKAIIIILLSSLLLVSVGAQAGEWTINYCKDLTADQVRKAARLSFSERKYKIEQETSNGVIGTLEGKKVEIAMTNPGRIGIRWVPGFEHKKDNWLKNLKYDMLEYMAGDIKQGEWAIKWCKDFKVDEFQRVAKWALSKRNYKIEKDTANSIIGDQKNKKVEIAMTTPGRIVIRWVPGAGYDKDNWLKSLYQDITWRLSE